MDSSIVTLDSTNITSDRTFVAFGGTLFFFLTFDNSIVTLGSTNITSNYTFVTFGGTIIFFLHVLTIPSSHWVIPTLLMTVLFSHLVGPLLFFFHI